MVIETSKFQKSFLLQLLQMCLVMMSHKISRKTWGLAHRQTLLTQQYILWQPIDSNSVTYHSNIFYMMQGLGLDQKEILQASMNDHHNPNDSLMNNHFRKGFSNFVCQTLCTKSIYQSINQVPSYNFQNRCQIPQLIYRTHHTLQAKVESLQRMRWVHLPH